MSLIAWLHPSYVYADWGVGGLNFGVIDIANWARVFMHWSTNAVPSRIDSTNNLYRPIHTEYTFPFSGLLRAF